MIIRLISSLCHTSCFFFFNDTATTEIYTLSLHDALPIYLLANNFAGTAEEILRLHLHVVLDHRELRSEEHTSELQSPCNLVCRLLLEKKKTSSFPCTTASELRNSWAMSSIRCRLCTRSPG